MSRYVGEALRGQLANAASTGGAPSDTVISYSGLMEEMTALVKRLLEASRDAGPTDVVSDPVAEAIEDHLTSETPGAPVSTPGRVVTGARGLKETGFKHDVVAYDPCLPPEAWVTRCGWRFGHSNHIIYEHTEADCPKCAICRRTGRGALYGAEKRRKVACS